MSASSSSSRNASSIFSPRISDADFIGEAFFGLCQPVTQAAENTEHENLSNENSKSSNYEIEIEIMSKLKFAISHNVYNWYN